MDSFHSILIQVRSNVKFYREHLKMIFFLFLGFFPFPSFLLFSCFVFYFPFFFLFNFSFLSSSFFSPYFLLHNSYTFFFSFDFRFSFLSLIISVFFSSFLSLPLLTIRTGEETYQLHIWMKNPRKLSANDNEKECWLVS